MAPSRSALGVCVGLVLVLIAGASPADTGPGASKPALDSLSDDVFYHFMPIAWRDGDGDTYRFGDFAGMTASLDYLADLGITAVWMNPVFPSPAYHGYQHGAADSLNPWFGSEVDFAAFCEAAHARGIKVFVDFVVYGISHDSPWFQDAYLNPSSIYDDWLAFEDGANSQYLGSTYSTWNGDFVGFIHWDLRAAAARSLVTDWGRKWLDPDRDGVFSDGVDGYRLDHVWQSYPYGPDGWGYNVDDFWVPFATNLRAVQPDVLLLAEQADWGTYGNQLFAGLDAAFTKPFEGAARWALQQEQSYALYSSMAATLTADSNTVESGTFLATIGNHDVDRLGSVIGPGFDKGRAAAAVLLTQPYPPVLYYGDEIGMLGAKDPSLGSDASDIPMREPFKWTAVDQSPMTAYHELHGPAWTNRISRDNDGRSVEEQDGVPGSLLESYRELIAARHANVALRRGDYEPVPSIDDAIWAFARIHAEQQLLVLINLDEAHHFFSVDLSAFELPSGPTTPVSVLDGTSVTTLDASNQASYPVDVPSYDVRIYELSLGAPTPPTSLVDGRGMWGRQLAVQTTEVLEGLDDVFELDRMLVRLDDERLEVALAGNLASGPGGLCLFYDVGAGGQNVLQTSDFVQPPSGPEQLTGTRMDEGFSPNGFLYVNNYQERLFVDQITLLDGGGTARSYRGEGTVGSGSGVLIGGDNESDLQVALDNSNQAGVTTTSVSGAGAVETGLELSIPLQDLGLVLGSGSVRLAACLLRSNGSVTNQWLPGLGPGVGEPGLAPDLRSYSGLQFVEVDLGGGPVAAPPAGSSLQLRARSQGGLSRIVFDLPRAGRVRLDVYDLRGRRVRRLLDATQPAGEHQLRWDGRGRGGSPVAAGVYLLQLRAGGETATAKLLRVD